jgi:crotonobetainyl-CoA:carnitine CoA-transferase CaiB-like acyl-CoA transferase
MLLAGTTPMAPVGFGGVFEAVNRGKRSIAVNYRLPRGRDVILRLARDADVFLEASMPGQIARRGLGPDDLMAANPRLVYCSLSGFGQAGP